MDHSPFSVATRAAIVEMIREHAHASKYGFVLTEEAVDKLSDSLLDLVVTSRNLKAAGDRILAGGGVGAGQSATPKQGSGGYQSTPRETSAVGRDGLAERTPTLPRGPGNRRRGLFGN